jgi:hypothetical protein
LHTSVGFVDFLSTIVASQPAGREIHIVADNLSAHKTEGVFEFLNTKSGSSAPLHAYLFELAQPGRNLVF